MQHCHDHVHQISSVSVIICEASGNGRDLAKVRMWEPRCQKFKPSAQKYKGAHGLLLAMALRIWIRTSAQHANTLTLDSHCSLGGRCPSWSWGHGTLFRRLHSIPGKGMKHTSCSHHKSRKMVASGTHGPLPDM